MRVNKEVLTKVGYIVKEYSKVVLPALGYAIFSQRGRIPDALDELRYSGNVGYDDAAKVIIDSDMLSSYKTQIFKLLKAGKDVEYYKTIIRVVKSDLLTRYKVELIEELNGKEDQA